MIPRALAAAPLLLSAAGAALLGGCGEGTPRGPRVEVVVTAVDQPAPPRLFLRGLAQEGKRWPLTPVAGVRGRVYEAVGAPDGVYALEGEGEDGLWGMLWPFGQPPELRAAAPEPRPIQLGRPRTLYVARESRDYRFTSEWGAFIAVETGKEPEGPPIALSAEIDEAGVAAVRIPAEAWRGRCIALGRLEGGGVTEAVVFEARASGHPALRRARPAPTLPLTVLAFRASDGGPPAETSVRLDIHRLALPVSADGTLRGGEARFAALPFLERDLHVTVPEAGGTFVLGSDEWFRDGEIRLLVPGEAAIDRTFEVRGVGGDLQIQALPPGGGSYALVPARRDGDRITLRLPPGEFLLLVRAGDAWAEARLPADGPGPTLDAAGFVPGTTVRIPTRGAPGGVVRFLRTVGDRRVLGQGLVAKVAATGDVDTRVPAGTYRIVWAYDGGEVAPSAEMTFAPGGQIVMPLDAPKPPGRR